MKHKQESQIQWGAGRLLAAALGLALVLCLLTAVNRLPRRIIAEPVHSAASDLYDFVLVDLNYADREALMRLPHIGEVLADRVIAARPFSSADDLLRVQGIGEGILNDLRPLVKCG